MVMGMLLDNETSVAAEDRTCHIVVASCGQELWSYDI